MKKIAIVYYSGTGNTELMAESIAEGASNRGAIVNVFTAKEFQVSMMDTYDAFAFGCPASGVEQLEVIEFEPMFKECLPKLKAKHISLFGSYGWGDGQWMRDWEETCLSHGADVVHDYVICVETPDGETLEACRHMGEALAMLPLVKS